jgi:anti-sigma regulatory factor (Ser/Thr protein kinase)
MSTTPAETPTATRHGIALLGSLTIPGRPEQAATARAFVTRALGDDCPHMDTAVLLTSELVTNSLQHSRSRRDGGIITVTLIAIPGGIRAEVSDEGGLAAPALRSSPDEPSVAEDGRGLHLVQALSTRWSYWHDGSGTLTWFELTEPIS